MKCVVDLDLLNPPPLPDTLSYRQIRLYQRKLAEFDNIKIVVSQRLQEMLWVHWSQVNHREHRDFLLQILSRHFVPRNFPSALKIETDQVHLEPPFLSGESEWVGPWLHSLMACYLDEQYNTGGALLATWPRDELAGLQDVQVTYHQMVEKLPIARDEVEWDALLAELDRPPIPFTADLCIYADESGPGQDEWVAVVVISEQQANAIGRAAITAYNQSKHPGNQDIREIHFSKLSQHGTERREPAQRKLAEHVVEGLCDARVACFIVAKRPGESEIDLYARGLRETLRAWKPDLICPIHIDTPYDLQNDYVQNRNLCGRVRDAIHSEDLDLASADIILGKSTAYHGLGIADAIAYLRGRRQETFWKELWQQLVAANCIQREA